MGFPRFTVERQLVELHVKLRDAKSERIAQLHVGTSAHPVNLGCARRISLVGVFNTTVIHEVPTQDEQIIIIRTDLQNSASLHA